MWSDTQFPGPLVTSRSLDLGLNLGSIAYGGQPLNNSGEESMFAANRQFNVANLASPSDHHITLHQTTEGTSWTPPFIHDFLKTKKPRLD